jgi:hypothetical protein
LTLAAAAALAAAGAHRAAGQTVWNGGTGNWNTAGNWSTGIVPNTGTTNVSIDGGKGTIASVVNLDLASATIGSLTIDAGDTLNFNVNTSLTLNGNATVNGLMSVGASGGSAFGVNFAGTNALTWGGSGQVVLGFPQYQLSNNTGTNVLTLGAGLTIHGRNGVFVGNGLGGFLNLATVSADVAGGTIDFNRPVTNGAGGVLQALSGGTLQFDVQAGSSGPGATMLAGAGSLLLFNTGPFTIADGGTIIGSGTTGVSGANLTFAGAGTISTTLSFSAGFITGSGPLAINGPLLWTGGQFGLTAGTATANNGITISGIGSKVMSAYHLINIATATANWSGGGGVFLGSASLFENQGTFNATGDATMQNNGGANSTFLNAGVFNKSSTANATTNIIIPFVNPGTVNVNSGTLAFGGGGTSTGNFVIAPGATLFFTGGYTVGPTGTIGGAGTLSVNATTLIVVGSNYTISSPLSFFGGFISGTGVLSLTGPLAWTGGTFTGGGTATASNGITITGPNTKSLSAYRLINAATSTATWGGASVFLGSGAVFENQGTFNATNDATFGNNGGAVSFIVNSGTFNKSSTANASTTINIPFTNSGTVNITSGMLTLSAGGSAPGGVFNLASGGTLVLNAGTFIIDPTTTIGGSGTVAIAGATLSVTGASAAIASPVAFSSGFISGGSNALVFNGPLTWTGGTLGAGNGTVTVNAGVSFSGVSSKAFSNYHLIIPSAATATWDGSGNILLGNKSLLENAGTFNAINDAPVVDNGGSASAFLNSGVFNKSSTANASTTINIAFTNSGTVNISSGTLAINAGGSAPGGKFLISAGGGLIFNAGTFNIDPTTTIAGSGTVAVNGATLSHGSGVGGVTIAAPLTLSSGFITGSNALAINAPFTWTGGTLGSGNGTATVNVGMTFVGPQNKALSAYRLVIAPTATASWSGGLIYLGSGSVLENRGTFNATNDSSVLNNGGAVPALVNSGVFNKSSIANGTTIISIPFTNSGTVNITSGVLDINAGGSAPGGTFVLAPAGTLLLDNATFNVDSTTTITGGGTVSLAGATLSLTGASVAIPSPLSFSSGFISGSSALSISGPFSWTGGTFGPGNGTATINTAAATISGINAKTLNVYHVVIAPTATVNWSGGFIYLGNGSILENDGTFNMVSDSTIAFSGGAISSLVNSGVINKSSPANDSSVIGVPFTNSGAVNINSGVLTVNLGGSAPTGTFAIAAGAGLLFGNGTFTLGSGPISGAGTAIVNFGTLAVPGSSVISAPLSFINGFISGSGSLSINGPLSWTGGSFGGGLGTATANGGIAISGAASKALGAYRLVNGPASTANWSDPGPILIGSAGVFENRGTFNATNDAAINFNGGAPSFFLNSGTFNKSSTASASTLIGIAFTNSGTVNITSGTLNLNGSGSDIGGVYNTSVGGNLLFTSNHSLDGASSIAGPGTTTVGNTNGAIANVAGGLKNFNQGTLIVNTNGSLALASNGARVTSHVDSLTINGNGTFDLGMNEMLTLSAPALMKTYLANAYDAANFQDWSKPGLTSRLARNNPTTYSVGYANGADQSAQDAGVTLHGGAPLAANQTVVRAVLTGDANMDGTVDFFDITQILGYKYNTTQTASYTDGDLDYSGHVDFFDIVLLLSANYNSGQVFGPAATAATAATTARATPSLTSAAHHASSTGVVASATTIGVPGDGKPDFEYNPATGDLRFRTDGGNFTTTGGSASFVSSLTISSASGILLGGGASAAFAGGTGATLTSTLLSSALTNSPGFGDGFDIGLVLAPGLSPSTLTADLTVKYQSLNGGSLKTADITVPEPAGLGLLALAGAGLLRRRRQPPLNRLRR